MPAEERLFVSVGSRGHGDMMSSLFAFVKALCLLARTPISKTPTSEAVWRRLVRRTGERSRSVRAALACSGHVMAVDLEGARGVGGRARARVECFLRRRRQRGAQARGPESSGPVRQVPSSTKHGQPVSDSVHPL
jgi:hypothetical protein